MNPVKILIVDDELPARQRMAMLLSDIQDVCPTTVVGDAGSAQAAMVFLETCTPDIILLDVQMPGTTGIELAQQLAATKAGVSPAIIFVSAYDEYAIKAFDVHAMDYLLKPVRAGRLAEAIARIVERQPRHLQAASLVVQVQKKQHFSVLERGRILLVPVVEVLFLKAEQKYVTLHTRQREYLIEDSLTSIEEEFSDLFVRAHRNALIRKSAIKGVERSSHIHDAHGEHEKVTEAWQIIVDGSHERLPVSRRQWPLIKALVR
ncbi:LytR/AlgR family response regulator transcription factor [Undibacterium sp. SXout7W]|uniref:LytR/AlgR family response regulator transcription factor n=1 Tax=Undibacterium sp. SXout7W TaxID=3413049 RepID=UPI003BF32ABE